VDRSWSNGRSGSYGARSLRPNHRPQALRYLSGVLHHKVSVWRREGGQKPSGSGKRGIKRSIMVDAEGIPLGVLCAPANRHASPLLGETLESVDSFIELPEQASVHLDRAYDSNITRQHLKDRGLEGVISEKGKPAPLRATKRWVVERTISWSNAHKKLVWCTEREGRVIGFWIAFSNVIIIVGRLLRKAWTHYRWQSRPQRRP
jgi:IS5 family transposase